MVHSRPSCSSNKAITPSCDGDTTVIVYVPSPPLPGAPPYNNPPPPCASNNFPKPSILPKNPSPSSSSDTPISSSTLPNNTPPPSSVDTYPLLPGNISYNPDFYPIKHLLPPNYHPPSTTLPGTTFPSQEYPVQIPEYPPIPSWLPPNNSSSTTLPETTFPSQEYPVQIPEYLPIRPSLPPSYPPSTPPPTTTLPSREYPLQIPEYPPIPSWLPPSNSSSTTLPGTTFPAQEYPVQIPEYLSTRPSLPPNNSSSTPPPTTTLPSQEYPVQIPEYPPIRSWLPPNNSSSTTLPGTTFPSQEYPVQIPEYSPIRSWLPPNNSSSTTLPGTTFPSQEYPVQIPEYSPIRSWLPPNNSSSTTLPGTTFPAQEYPVLTPHVHPHRHWGAPDVSPPSTNPLLPENVVSTGSLPGNSTFHPFQSCPFEHAITITHTTYTYMPYPHSVNMQSNPYDSLENIFENISYWMETENSLRSRIHQHEENFLEELMYIQNHELYEELHYIHSHHSKDSTNSISTGLHMNSVPDSVSSRNQFFDTLTPLDSFYFDWQHLSLYPPSPPHTSFPWTNPPPFETIPIPPPPIMESHITIKIHLPHFNQPYSYTDAFYNTFNAGRVDPSQITPYELINSQLPGSKTVNFKPTVQPDMETYFINPENSGFTMPLTSDMSETDLQIGYIPVNTYPNMNQAPSGSIWDSTNDSQIQMYPVHHNGYEAFQPLTLVN